MRLRFFERLLDRELNARHQRTDAGPDLLLLANTDGLSAPYPLAAGRLGTSPWARAFLETFVIAKLPLD